MREVYFDHQSGTPVLPEALDAMRPFFTESVGNPSALHRHGIRARDALSRARAQIAELIGAASPEEILFTSDGTESANLAIKGAAYASRRRGNHIVLTAAEHPSLLNSVEFLETQGFTATRVGVDGLGRVNPDALQAALTDQTILICVHHANHDIGTVQPVREIGDIAGEHGIPLYVDADTSAGWLPVNVGEMGASLLSFSPGRFHGPKGVGVLYRSRRARLQPILHGGSQEDGKRAGTENVPGIVGAGVAAEIAARELVQRAGHVTALQKTLWDNLPARVSHLHLNGPPPGPERICTSLNFSAACVEGEGQALLLDMNGIAVGSGTSCISKSLKVSHVLEATGLDYALAQAAIILSLGKDNTADDASFFLETFPKVIDRLRSLSPTWEEFQRDGNPGAHRA